MNKYLSILKSIKKRPQENNRYPEYDKLFSIDGKKLTFIDHHSRIVYKYKNYVIKFCTDAYINAVMDQNKREWEVYNALSKNDRKYFAKCYAYFRNELGSFLLQERIPRVYVVQMTPKETELVSRLSNKYDIWDLPDANYGEDSYAYNLCRNKNRIVIYDYGYRLDKNE